MCVTSMVMDHYREKWEPYTVITTGPWNVMPSPITQAEIDGFRTLLARAREYDKRTNQPECEMADKKQAIETIAKQLGVEISFL